MDQTARIKSRMEKSATTFATGGFRPENTIAESWIGRVFTYGKEEEIPTDAKDRPMLPLAQFHLPGLPFIPEQLKDKKLLTVFMSGEFPDILAENGENYVIREYGHKDEIIIKDIQNPDSYLKAFPLRPDLVTDDCPLWDGGGLERKTEDEVLELEKSGVIESYYDIAMHHYKTKLGGYPSFCQSGIDFGEGFEFVFQIADDPRANLNILDAGSFMFAKNVETGVWRLYYDSH